MEKQTAVAVDIAKPVFEVAVSHQPGRVAERRRLSRDAFFAQMPVATVVTEACGASTPNGGPDELMSLPS